MIPHGRSNMIPSPRTIHSKGTFNIKSNLNTPHQSSTTPAVSPQHHSIAPLTGIRIILQCCIVLFHFFRPNEDPYASQTPLLGTIYANFSSNGYFAVNGFMILSACFTFQSLVGMIEKRRKWVGSEHVDREHTVLHYDKDSSLFIRIFGLSLGEIWQFWKKRFWRLYPLYFVSLILGFTNFIYYYTHHSSMHKNLPRAVREKLFIVLFVGQAYHETHIFDSQLNGPSWFLSTILLMILVAPFLMAPIIMPWCSTLRGTLSYTFVMYLNCMLIGYSYWRAPGGHNDWTKYAPWIRIWEALLGGSLAFLLRHLQGFCDPSTGGKSLKQVQRRVFMLSVVQIASAAVILGCMCLMEGYNRNGAYPFTIAGALLDPVWIVLFLSLALNERGILSLLMSLPWLVKMSDYSYAVYLLQGPVYQLLRNLTVKSRNGQPVNGMLYVVLLGVVSVAATKFTNWVVNRIHR